MTEIRSVPAAQWFANVQGAREDGFTFFDWFGAVDDVGRADTLSLTLSLVALDAARPRWVWVRTEVRRDGGRLASVRTLFPGAGWHEREAAELFGITFEGGDPRRLLLSPGFTGTPLRKDEVLAARTAEPWPGTKEPGESGAAEHGVAAPSRRRMVPPGVPDPEVWGDRDPAAGPVDPAAVAASAVGGRVRRRRP
ncbi:MAG: NADH-quinone oxidoreductase subunit C [Propionibacteriaceae bacterium]